MKTEIVCFVPRTKDLFSYQPSLQAWTELKICLMINRPFSFLFINFTNVWLNTHSYFWFKELRTKLYGETFLNWTLNKPKSCKSQFKIKSQCRFFVLFNLCKQNTCLFWTKKIDFYLTLSFISLQLFDLCDTDRVGVLWRGQENVLTIFCIFTVVWPLWYWSCWHAVKGSGERSHWIWSS
jgi:hypothetical protein